MSSYVEQPDALDREPLLGVLHRRHPDVDVVVLPPQAVPAVVPPTAALEEALAVTARAHAALDTVSAGHRADGEPAPVSSLWRRQGVSHEHRLVVRTVLLDLEDPMSVLTAAADRLTDQGWRVQRLLEPRPRVEGLDGPVRIRVDAHPGAVEVEALGEPLVLDREQLRTLSRRSRRDAR